MFHDDISLQKPCVFIILSRSHLEEGDGIVNGTILRMNKKILYNLNERYLKEQVHPRAVSYFARIGNDHMHSTSQSIYKN